MSSVEPVTIRCPAKVNLALSIGGPRADGLHPLASWFVALDLRDDLTAAAIDGDSRFDIAYAADAPVAATVDWPIEKDLAYRALRLLEATAGRPLPTGVVLRKRIPAGGGLGGGSSDAAGMLVAVDRLHRLRLGEVKLIELAAKLGSDVPFFVAAQHGKPSTIVADVGQIITPARRDDIIHLVLIFPGLHCPTGEVYRTFDTLRPAAPPPDIDRVALLAGAPTVTPHMPFNDLAEPALTVRPELRALRDNATSALGRPVHVSGSGSTLFVVAMDDDDARDLAERATHRLHVPAWAARSL